MKKTPTKKALAAAPKKSVTSPKKPDGGKLFGTAVLGERGQIVIPKEIREALKLKRGDTFVAILNHEAIVFLPKKMMENFIQNLTAKLNS